MAYGLISHRKIPKVFHDNVKVSAKALIAHLAWYLMLPIREALPTYVSPPHSFSDTGLADHGASAAGEHVAVENTQVEQPRSAAASRTIGGVNLKNRNFDDRRHAAA
ncbi:MULTISPECIES: hypothetical protein [Mesorhizobium]|uniref:hypothetical protein n=1 Tax=Mesorhizobium TaxID=68287 RepID=UPI001140AE5F|nr:MULTISPECIES: hypothetical protein [Mesorhizobium]